jgi:hypothetical protein
MTCAQRYTSQKSPLLAFQPVVVLDIIRICEKRIEGEEWNGVQMRVPRKGDMQARFSNLIRLHGDGGPVVQQVNKNSKNQR